ncbi:hypothetical protein [Beijerinckia mobilis]|uniref:hypothetical protein n=1 Tax=Beijerinckia mobilis TaxID=231434 RepID=UPI0012EC6A75|nr:hypothetical protein [Beijerinckia mobilis]
MNAFITGGVKSQARLGPLMQDTASGCFLVTVTDSEGKPGRTIKTFASHSHRDKLIVSHQSPYLES